MQTLTLSTLKIKICSPEWWRRCFCYLFVIYSIRPLCWQHLLGLDEGVSLEDIQTQYPYVTDWHTYSFTNETEKSDLLSHADIVSQASSMNTGDVSEPFLDGTYPCIIKVTRKEDATVIPLAEVRNRITDYLLNSRISTETELIQNRLVFTETDAFQNTSIE